jgi:hypothetical protein
MSKSARSIALTPDVFQVLAEPRRRDVLALVADRERTAGEIAARSTSPGRPCRIISRSCSRPAWSTSAGRAPAASGDSPGPDPWIVTDR